MDPGCRYAGDGGGVGAARATTAPRVTATARAAMLRDASARRPHEACGLLFCGPYGDLDHYVALPNVDPDPRTAFALDPLAVLAAIDAAAAADRSPAAVFHSHPAGPAGPSPADLAGAWPDLWMVIASPAADGWRLLAVAPSAGAADPTDL